jgi:hypothetical protein
VAKNSQKSNFSKKRSKIDSCSLKILYLSYGEGIFSFGKARDGTPISIIRRLSGTAAKTEKSKSANVGTEVAHLSLPLLNGRHKTTPTQ